MKKTYPLLLLLCFLFACSTEDSIVPVDQDDDFINKAADGSFQSESEVGLRVDGTDIGTLSVSLVRDSIFLRYNLNDDVVASDLKFHVATSRESLPNSAGVLSPEAFSFTRDNFAMPLSKIAGSRSFKGSLFFAFFCKLYFFKGYDENKSVNVKVHSTHTLASPSYFTVHLTGDGEREFLGYCFQGDQSMDTSAIHSVKRLSSLSKNKELLDKVVDAPENLDLVNWLLNQDSSKWMRNDGQPANGADRQMAIWKLVETTGNPTGVNIAGKFDIAIVNKMVKDAKASGENFKPKCGEKFIYLLHKGPIGAISQKGTYNSGAYASPDYQVTGVLAEVKCVEPEYQCWAPGKKYISNDNGTYFVMYKD